MATEGPEKPNMVRVVLKMNSAFGDEESVFTYSNDYSFDSPSPGILRVLIVSGNSMMSESFSAYGRLWG